MDYADMADSLRKQQSNVAKEELIDLTLKQGYYDGCKKIDWELEELCHEMDRNSTVRYLSGEEGKKYMEARTARHYHTPTGKEPFYRQHVKIVQEMLGYKVPVVS